MAGFQYGAKSIWRTFPESVDILLNCIALRMSASETAAKMAAQFKMPVTPNMCIGKARLLKIRFDSDSKNNTYSKHGLGRIRASRAASAVQPAKPIKIAIAALEKPVDSPHGHGIPLAALTRRECRWPTGADDDGHHLFCGEDVSEATLDIGRCYCEFHNEIAYRPSGQVNMRPVFQANSTRAGIQE
jgi:hypothetical protein